jgi:hypothetical protein
MLQVRFLADILWYFKKQGNLFQIYIKFPAIISDIQTASLPSATENLKKVW